jgi:hypothetical protein
MLHLLHSLGKYKEWFVLKEVNTDSISFACENINAYKLLILVNKVYYLKAEIQLSKLIEVNESSNSENCEAFLTVRPSKSQIEVIKLVLIIILGNEI